MAFEVTDIAQSDSSEIEAGQAIAKHNEKKSLRVTRRREQIEFNNANGVRTVQSVTSVCDRACDDYVKDGVDRRPDTNNDSNFNTARSECDKSKLSCKVIRDRNGRNLATDNNAHCDTESFNESERCSHYYSELINGLRNNNFEGVVVVWGFTNGLATRLTTSIECNKIGAPPSSFCNGGMIAGAHSGDNINKNDKNNGPVLSPTADVSARNAQNCCRDDRLPIATNDFDSVTATPVRLAQTSRPYHREEGNMNFTLDSDIDAESYLRRNSCVAYTNSSRTSRSAENTPETGSCKTIGRDKSPVRPRCKLNENNCLSLHDILLSFNGPISEEQAWALCYQCAKCFKAALYPGSEAEANRNEQFYDVTELAHVLLHKDGDVHSTIIRDPNVQSDTRELFTSEHKLVFSLGLIVFGALDFGLDEEEERRVAPDLEALITLMTQPEDDSEVEERLQETDDEGIERDSGESEDDPLHQTPAGHGVHPAYIRRTTPPPGPHPPAPCSVNTVLQLCTRHLQGTPEQADTHYKAVIRALVAEALELSHFLQKVAADKQGNSGSSAGVTREHHLDTLDFSDWARFWVQVIGELRRGVKLKKVEKSIGNGGTGPGPASGKRVRSSGRGIEFELTPYEILMDDIRARRYRLRKTPSPSPHLRKDAHAVILDFIRSRPPLKKASERKLPPLKRQSTPRELLMESIKRPPRPLRPSSVPNKATSVFNTQATTPTRSCASGGGAHDDEAAGNTELITTPKSSRRESTDPTLAPRYQPRRLIIPLDFKLDGEDEDDDDDDEDAVTRFEDDAADCWRDEGDEDDIGNGEVGGQTGRAGESANPWRRTGGLRLTRNEYHRFCDTQLESYDLATQCPSRRVSSRRHTVVGAGLGNIGGTLSLPHSRPQSRQHELGNRNDTAPTSKVKDHGRFNPEQPSSLNSLQDELAQEKSPSKGNPSLGNMFLDDRLSLTLEEIVHIRSVLTKAELESLPVEGRVKEDVEKRRVCFLCLKTRFGILGPWGQRCRLCERTVCVKCYSKMRIPTEHFAHVPVVLLSPSLMLSPPSEVDGKGYASPSHGTVRSLWPRPAGGVGSAPASPASKRRDPTLRNTTPTPTPTPSLASSSHQDEEGAPCNSLPPSNNSPATGSGQTSDKSRRFYCSSANSSPARILASASRYGAGDLRVAERLRGVAMVVCHDCRIMVLQIIKSSRTTRATIRNNAISRLTLNLSPIYV